MTVGISTTNLANVWLNVLRSTFPSTPSAVYVKLSAALTSSQAWASGNTFTLTTQGWSLSPLAA